VPTQFVFSLLNELAPKACCVFY